MHGTSCTGQSTIFDCISPITRPLCDWKFACELQSHVPHLSSLSKLISPQRTFLMHSSPDERIYGTIIKVNLQGSALTLFRLKQLGICSGILRCMLYRFTLPVSRAVLNSSPHRIIQAPNWTSFYLLSGTWILEPVVLQTPILKFLGLQAPSFMED